MTKPVIEVENLSKLYRISHARKPYHTLREDLMELAKTPMRFLRGHQSYKEEFWALKDVSFDVEQGEVLGIVGKNGAGKSTLLKILSRITDPTSGRATLRGRVASLLEVGTGFHPELTGRENVYLNGTFLGMSRQEISRKFDEIVDFAEVEKFLDTPVKFYSSGMYVRLAFAVAAHLEPEILIIDEVLAVGDVAFQKKSLGKMSRVAKEGRTVLFVSHSLGAVSQLCEKVLYLENGKVVKYGPKDQVLPLYFGSTSSSKNEKVKVVSRLLKGNSWERNSDLAVEIRWPKGFFKPGWEVDIAAYNLEGAKIFAVESQKLERFSSSGKLYRGIKFILKNPGFSPRNIRLDVGVREGPGSSYKVLLENALTLTPSATKLPRYTREDTIVTPEARFELVT